MNDFTKEDLKDLLKCISIVVIDFGTSNILEQLKKKIESMIDNYDAKIIESWHCEKCGHVQ